MLELRKRVKFKQILKTIDKFKEVEQKNIVKLANLFKTSMVKKPY